MVLLYLDHGILKIWRNIISKVKFLFIFIMTMERAYLEARPGILDKLHTPTQFRESISNSSILQPFRRELSTKLHTLTQFGESLSKALYFDLIRREHIKSSILWPNLERAYQKLHTLTLSKRARHQIAPYSDPFGESLASNSSILWPFRREIGIMLHTLTLSESSWHQAR